MNFHPSPSTSQVVPPPVLTVVVRVNCAADGRYEFFLAAQPLNITGAVGSPVNPIAIK